MRLTAGMVAVVCTFALWGCGTTPRDQVRGKVEELARAAAKHDYAQLCRQILAPSLITRLADAGVGCVKGMEIAFAGVQDPTLSIGRIDVRGRSAQAITLTMAKGQEASLDAIDLVKTAQGWRVSSLGSPLSETGGR